MKFVAKDLSDTVTTPTMQAREYDFRDPKINTAHITLHGRYPATGSVRNTASTMCCYILAGSGTLTVEDSTFELEEGDACIIDKGECYYWDADMTMLITSTPAWSTEQTESVP